MIKIVLTLFLIGHVLGDFYLQSSELAINKDESLNKLLKHSVIYLIAMTFVFIPVFSLNLLKWIFIISAAHCIVDLVKYFIRKKISIDYKSELVAYFLDQIIHIFIIIICTMIIYLQSEPISYINFIQYILNKIPVDVLSVLSCVLILLIIIQPSSITIKKVLYRYRPKYSEEKEGHDGAGGLIGILERFIILLFLFVGQYAAIGFVLTAKSIARYNKIAEEPKFSEYYLLGTLLSSMIVIVSYLVIF